MTLISVQQITSEKRCDGECIFKATGCVFCGPFICLLPPYIQENNEIMSDFGLPPRSRGEPRSSVLKRGG
jgi:hypothetical protein